VLAKSGMSFKKAKAQRRKKWRPIVIQDTSTRDAKLLLYNGSIQY